MSGMPGWPCHPDASAGAAASETAAACEGRPRRRSRTSSTSCTKRSTPPPGCRRQPARRQQNPSAKTATRQSQPLHACTNPGVRQTCAIRASGLLAGPQRAATALAPIATEPGRHGLPKRHCGRDVPSGSTAVAHRAGGSPVECRLIWLPGRQPDRALYQLELAQPTFLPHTRCEMPPPGLASSQSGRARTQSPACKFPGASVYPACRRDHGPWQWALTVRDLRH